MGLTNKLSHGISQKYYILFALVITSLILGGSPQSLTHIWHFTRYNEQDDRVYDQGTPTAYQLYYYSSNANAVTNYEQNGFNLYSDPIFGIQYAGQYSQHAWSSVPIFQQYNLFWECFYYTYITTNYVIYTQDYYPTPPGQTGTKSPYMPNTASFQGTWVVGSPTLRFLQIGVQGDGKYFFGIRLINNEMEQYYLETTTTLKPGLGWNYVALYIDEIYEMSYVTMYARYENMASNSITGLYLQKYQTQFPGFYDENIDKVVDTSVKLGITLGCQHYTRIWSPPSATDKYDNYGLCMQGWIQMIATQSIGGRQSTTSYLTTLAGGPMWPTDNNIYIRTGGAADFCNIFILNAATKGCFSKILITDTKIFSFDTSTANIISSTSSYSYGSTNTPIPSFLCIMALTTGAPYNPLYQQYIGRITSNQTNYFSCQILHDTVNGPIANKNSVKSMFGAMFTIEAWFRFDPVFTQPDGYISTIMAVWNSASSKYVLGFSVSNKFLRIYVDDTIQDIHYEFNSTRDYWHYVAVSYRRQYRREVTLNIYIDDVQVMETNIFDWHFYDYKQTTYYLHVGNNFPGVVRKTKINSRPYVFYKKSLWITTDQTKCVQRGATGCQFCDLDEVATTSTYNCFPTCSSFNYYIDSSYKCQSCHSSCSYCQNSNANTNCYRCNSTTGWVQDVSKGNITTNWQDGSTIKCKCSEGTYMTDDLRYCRKCDPACMICNTFLTQDCAMCADGAYKLFKDKCGYSCPTNYVYDDTNNLCSLDLTHQALPQKPSNPKGCMDGYYFDFQSQTCKQCYYQCNTCEISSSLCTSCPLGRYLTSSGSCSTCVASYSTDMLYGSDGSCIETCGDGKNYGLLQCDDGNTNNGDGCSSSCLVEDNWVCRKGYQGGNDYCGYNPTILLGATVNSQNDIILEFSRPVYFKSGDIQSTDLVMNVMSQNGSQTVLNYTVLNHSLPTSYLYLQTQMDNQILGGAYHDNLVVIQYGNTNNIYDINKREVKKSAQAYALLNPFEPYIKSEMTSAAFFGRLTIILVSGALSFWITLSLITGKSSMPALFVFLAFQSVFYFYCQDVYLDGRMNHYMTFFRPFRLEHIRFLNNFLTSNWINISSITKTKLNNNLYQLAEMEYINFLINNNVKFFLMVAYFLLMPIVVIADFVVTQCLDLEMMRWFHRLASKYFFGATFLIIIIYSLPVGLTAVIEIYNNNHSNNSTMYYSYIVCCIALTFLIILLLTIWVLIIQHYGHLQHSQLQQKYNFIFKPMKKGIQNIVFTAIFITCRYLSFVVMGVLYQQTITPVLIQAVLVLITIQVTNHKSSPYNNIGLRLHFQPDSIRLYISEQLKKGHILLGTRLSLAWGNLFDNTTVLGDGMVQDSLNEFQMETRRDDINFNDSMNPMNHFPSYQDLKSKRIVDENKEPINKRKGFDPVFDVEYEKDEKMMNYKEGYIKRSKWKPTPLPPAYYNQIGITDKSYDPDQQFVTASNVSPQQVANMMTSIPHSPRLLNKNLQKKKANQNLKGKK